MKTEMNGNKLELIVGDITKQKTEAIVNAANGTLLGGGGVDGAIHRAVGRQLLEACKHIRKTELNGGNLPTGEVVITKGYHLEAKYVIHTVGPIWQENPNEQEQQLANCYTHSLELAKEKGVTSISFPSISTGAYGYPLEEAAKIALTAVTQYLRNNHFGDVVFTLFSKDDYEAYRTALEKINE